MKNTFLFITLLFITGITFSQNKPAFKVSVSGKGKLSILFIPGFASSGEVWNDTKSLFEKQYTCYTLTMPGFAGVAAESEPTMAIWEKEIADYITTKHINKPILVGHSMGGVLSLAIASDYPDLVSKIVVVDALPCLQALANPAFKHKDPNDCGPMVTQFLTITDDQFSKMQKGGVAQMVSDTSHQQEVVQWSMTSDRKTFAQMYCDFSNTDLRERISGIKCPALILLEPYFKNIQSSITDQYKNLKTADLEYATKGLHFIMYDDKLWYDQQLIAFIAK